MVFFIYKKNASQSPESTAPENPANSSTQTLPDSAAPESVAPITNPIAVIETTHGNIKIELLADNAPQTVERIKTLITSKFYDGLTFHRVEPGLLIQGGDPKGTGEGGSGQTVPPEFQGPRKHIAGAVGMARTPDPNSGDSQFYIMMTSYPSLDGQYTVFGQVTEGLDVVGKVQLGDKMIRVYLE